MPLEHQPDTQTDRFTENYADPVNDQNLVLALVAGAVSAAIGALIWAAITVITGWQIGFMAIGVGCLVGIAVKVLGNGQSQIFGVIGAVFSLLGCLAGNYLTVIGFVASEFDMGYIELLKTTPFELVVDIMKEGFSPVDILFYGLALFQGYKLAFDDLNAVE